MKRHLARRSNPVAIGAKRRRDLAWPTTVSSIELSRTAPRTGSAVVRLIDADPTGARRARPGALF